MFEKILVANRGEVALRIMRVARELGVKTVAAVALMSTGYPTCSAKAAASSTVSKQPSEPGTVGTPQPFMVSRALDLCVKTVAVYSTEDASTYPVQYADEAVCIGPAQSAKSYLVMSSIIAAAKNTGAQAIHPGYGFLADRPGRAPRACPCRRRRPWP